MKLFTLLLLACSSYAQSNASSPWTARANKTTNTMGEIRIEGLDGHYFGFHARSTAAGNYVVELPNTFPTAGTCLGYSGVLQLDWVTCAAGTSYDPTLGILMVNSTNAGVTGTGDGGHYYWDTTSHAINIQSWFGGSVAPVVFNASQVQIGLLNENACIGSGCQINGFRINSNSGNNANDLTQGGHFNFDTTTNTLHINSNNASSLPGIIQLSASSVNTTNIQSNIQLNTIPTLCASGQYARGVDVNINATGCSSAGVGTVTSVGIASTDLSILGSPITSSGNITLNIANTITAGTCGSISTLCIATYNNRGLITSVSSTAYVNPSLGVYMTNDTNTGVTGTGDGLHIYWDPVAHSSSIQSWLSGSVSPLTFNVSYISAPSYHGNVVLNTIPTLCPAGQYARGIDTTMNGNGCTPDASGSGVDATLGLIGINDTNPNTTGTTVGMHIYYNPTSINGNINVYNSSNALVPLIINSSNLLTTGTIAQFNTNINARTILPSADNTYTLGNSFVRFSDIRGVTGHFGDTPIDIPTGTTLQMANYGLSIMVQDAYSGNIAAYVMRASNGSLGSPSGLLSNQTVGVMGARGFDGSSWVTSTNAAMVMTATQNWNSGAHGMKLTFNTTALNQLSGVQRVQFDENGITVANMAAGSIRAVCVQPSGLMYAAVGTTCP